MAYICVFGQLSFVAHLPLLAVFGFFSKVLCYWQHNNCAVSIGCVGVSGKGGAANRLYPVLYSLCICFNESILITNHLFQCLSFSSRTCVTLVFIV